MANRFGDRVLETTITTGTGNLTMAGAVTGHQTFDALCTVNGDTHPYALAGTTQWEVGILTRVSAGVYSRDVRMNSSGTAAALTLASGVKEVWGDVPAFLMRFLNMQESVVADSATPDVGATHTGLVRLDGTTTITSFGTEKNQLKLVRFNGARTLTYNATTLILPGLANITTEAGDTCLAVSDGSGNWRVMDYTRGARASFTGKLIGTQVFTASGTYTRSAGCKSVIAEVWGGGGGSGGRVAPANGSEMSIGCAGGAGGYSLKRITNPGATETVTVGAAGAAGASGNNAGGNGGTSSFGSHCSATGGTGGAAGASATGAGGAATNGGAGGAGSGGDTNISGQGGNANVFHVASVFAAGGSGGNAPRGGPGGKGSSFSTAAAAGATPGGGASGSVSSLGTGGAAAGADGGAGYVLVWEYE